MSLLIRAFRAKRFAYLALCWILLSSSDTLCSAFGSPKSLITKKVSNESPSAKRSTTAVLRMQDTCYDVVIVGGGPMGLSAAYECAKDNKKVLLLERFVLYNQSGSSNDLVRMYRTMYTEDFMADLAHQAIDAWDDLEKAVGEPLILRTGLLNFGDPNYKSGPEGNLKDPIKNLERLNMKYQELSVDDIETNFPFRNLPSNFQGLWAPDNGCINVPLMLRQLTRLCEETKNVEIVQFAKVHKLDTSSSSDQVTVSATIGERDDCQELKTFVGRKSIITAGAYTNQILDPSFNLRLDLDIWEMSYEYYDCNSKEEYPANPEAQPGTLESISGNPFKSMWFQFKESEDGCPEKSNLFYGFPPVPWGIKNNARIAVDHAVRRIRDPSERKISPATFDLQSTTEFVSKYLKGVLLQPNFAGTCLQANVYDNMFVLDHLPPSVKNHKNVAIFTAGWGMKFVPVIGKALKELVFNDVTEYTYDLSQFKITRSDSHNSVIEKSSQEGATSIFRKQIRGSSLSRDNSHIDTSDYKVPFSRAAYGKKLAPNLKLTRKKKLHQEIKCDDLKIGIVGGGAAGLYAALILKDIKYPAKLDIFEANPDRLGGRIFTKYFGKPNGEDYKYYDVGAMRFPRLPIHDRVIGEQPWSLANYLNKKLDSNPIKLVPYYFAEDGNIMYFNGIKKKSFNVNGPDPFKFEVMKCSEQLSSDELLDFAIKELKDALVEDFNKGFETLMKYDKMSVRSYMQTFLKVSDKPNMISFKGKYPDKVIDMIETLENSTGMYSRASITEAVIDEYDFINGVQWACVDGGSSRFIDAMEKVLEKEDTVKTTMGAQVTKMSRCQQSDKINLTVEKKYGSEKTSKTYGYDHVVSTLPFGVLRSIDTAGLDLSQEKREAIRVLAYDNSCKVGIYFENRWWQDESAAHPITGGQSSTDLPSRTIVYPSYGDANSPGVLIASYTWVQDADRMSALSHEERLEVCLRDLEEIHGPIVRKQRIVDSFSYSFYHDEFSQGAFALFGPGQFASYFDSCLKTEEGGRLHFAGEATSVHHAWVVGALNSAYRAVVEILQTRPEPERSDYLEKLIKKWGTVEEIEIEGFCDVDDKMS